MKAKIITYEKRKPKINWVRAGKYHNSDSLSVGGKILYRCVTHRLGIS